MVDWHFTVLLAKLVGAMALASLVLFGVVWRRGAALRAVAVRLTLSAHSLLVVLVAAEAFFAGCYVQSDGYGTTLAGLRWFHLHWQPINSLGYRDEEPRAERDHQLLVVGDSIVAGHGVDRIDDRLSGHLQRSLGADWGVSTIAQCGWDPLQEIEGLAGYPIRPDRIVLSYYINDIESAARALGNEPPTELLAQPPPWTRRLVAKSYFFNWFYWRVLRGRFGTIYWDWLKEAYEDPAVIEKHGEELDHFIEYAEEVGAELTFVVWPNLDYVEGSRPYTDRIVALLEERDVPVIDLGEHFAGRPTKSLVVNSMDGHPNPAAHAEVADLLLKKWQMPGGDE